MAGWREEITKQASYKGIPFTVESSLVKVGRKITENSAAGGGLFNIPNPFAQAKKQDTYSQEKPGYTDAGLEGREITITANFNGEDYNLVRDQFIDAIEAGGPGKLVLPTYPVIQKALAKNATINFDGKKGGYESVTVTFYEESEIASPAQAPATKSETNSSATQAATSAGTNFSENQTVPVNESSLDRIVEDVLNFFDAAVENLPSGAIASSESYDEAVATLDDIKEDGEVIAADPDLMKNSFFDALNALSSAFTSTEAAFSAQLGVASSYAGKIQAVTGTGALALERTRNQVAQLVMIQTYCISNAASILASVDFASVDEVVDVRQRFTAAVRDLQSTIGTQGGFPDTYRDLLRLNAAVFNDLVQRSAALPVLEEQEINTTIGGAHYAYLKYGDADRVTEILRRNDIRRSLFTSGELRLLSR